MLAIATSISNVKNKNRLNFDLIIKALLTFWQGQLLSVGLITVVRTDFLQIKCCINYNGNYVVKRCDDNRQQEKLSAVTPN